MAIYAATTEGEEALAAATAETVVQLRGGSTTRARIIAWSISFDGTDATAAPVVVDLLRQTTDGTASAGSENPFDPVDPASGITAFHSFTAEPTAGEIIESYEIHPNGGLVIREYPLGREPVIDDSTSSRIAIRATAPAAVNCVAWIQWDE